MASNEQPKGEEIKVNENKEEKEEVVKKVDFTNKMIKPVRGTNVSGTKWKEAHRKRSIAANVPTAGLSWKEKMEMKEQRKRMKALEDEIKQRNAAEEAARKEKRKQTIIRKRENALKNTVVQQVTNKKKIRHMSKKDFRKLCQYHFDEIE